MYLKPLGYGQIIMPGAPLVEYDTFTCKHCQRIVRVTPRCPPEDMGGRCGICSGLICEQCVAAGKCDPWEKKMRRMEARANFLRSAGLALFLLCVLCASAVDLCAQALTTITGPVRDGLGRPVNGRYEISWPAFKSADNFTIAAGRMIVAVIGGEFSGTFALVPNTGSTPATVYTVDACFTTCVRELWTVPAVGPVVVHALRTSVSPPPVPTIPQQQLTAGSGFAAPLGLWNQTADPVVSGESWLYWRSDTNQVRLYDGAAWANFPGDANIPASITRDSESPAAGDITGSHSAGYQIAAGAIVDADINATGITTRSKLPSALAYEDEAQTYSLTQSFTLAPVFSAMAAGSIPFCGTNCLLSQNNTNLFWDDANQRLRVGPRTGFSSSMTSTMDVSRHVFGKIGAAADEYQNVFVPLELTADFSSAYPFYARLSTAGTAAVTGEGTASAANASVLGSGNSALLNGGLFTVELGPSSTGSVTDAIGLQGQIVPVAGSTGNIPTARSVVGQIRHGGGGTITNGYALQAMSAQDTGAGVITNNYGLKVESQTAGVNNWAIKTEGAAKSEFGGNVKAGPQTGFCAGCGNQLSSAHHLSSVLDTGNTSSFYVLTEKPNAPALVEASGILAELHTSGTTAVSGAIYGANISTQHRGSAVVATSIGVFAAAEVRAESSGSATALHAVHASVAARGTGVAVTDARGVYSKPLVSDDGDITNAVGFYADNCLDISTGAITNCLGLDIASITSGTNNWAIRTGASGKVEVGDHIQQTGDAADSQFIRMLNGQGFGWEASPAGTDVTLTVNSSEVLTSSAPISAATGFQVGGAAASGNYLRGDGLHFVSNTIQEMDIPAAIARDTEIVGYMLQYSSSALASPADATTYFTGCLPVLAPGTAANVRRCYIGKAGTVKHIELTIFTTTAGSAETSTGAFRLNDTTDTTITGSIVNDTSNSAARYAADVNVVVAVGDFFEIKWIAPTWSTNPANVYFSGSVYIQ